MCFFVLFFVSITQTQTFVSDMPEKTDFYAAACLNKAYNDLCGHREFAK